MKTLIAALLIAVACTGAQAKKDWKGSFAQANQICSDTADAQMTMMSMRYNNRSKSEAIALLNKWSFEGKVAPVAFSAYMDMINDMWSSEMNADLRANWSPRRVFIIIYNDCMSKISMAPTS